MAAGTRQSPHGRHAPEVRHDLVVRHATCGPCIQVAETARHRAVKSPAVQVPAQAQSSQRTRVGLIGKAGLLQLPVYVQYMKDHAAKATVSEDNEAKATVGEAMSSIRDPTQTELKWGKKLEAGDSLNEHEQMFMKLLSK